MGYSEQAIRKGMAAEYLAKAFYSKQYYSILLPDSHETSYDFIATKDDEYIRVQVKSAIFFGDLVRFRNKHGQNAAYTIDSYDILAGVWLEKTRIYLFESKRINEQGYGESITVDTISGRTLSNHERLIPFFAGQI